jgi:hypothetical protein
MKTQMEGGVSPFECRAASPPAIAGRDRPALPMEAAISQTVGGGTDSPLILHNFPPLFLTKPFLQILKGS